MRLGHLTSAHPSLARLAPLAGRYIGPTPSRSQKPLRSGFLLTGGSRAQSHTVVVRSAPRARPRAPWNAGPQCHP
jgi:hypothetical protein